MNSSKLVRVGGFAAILAGVFNAAQGIPEMFDKDPTDLNSLADYLLESTFGVSMVALLVTFVALLRLHTGQGSQNYGRLGRVGFFAAFVGSVLMVVKTLLIVVIGLAFGGQTVTNIVVVFMVLYMAGSLLAMLGLVLLGIATLRAGLWPAARRRGGASGVTCTTASALS
jgi:hypothetical protein